MGILYSDEPYTGPLVPYDRQNATRTFLRHYDCSLYLTFLLRESRDAREKAQAQRELDRAQSGMERARRHPNYDTGEAERGAAEAPTPPGALSPQTSCRGSVGGRQRLPRPRQGRAPPGVREAALGLQSLPPSPPLQGSRLLSASKAKLLLYFWVVSGYHRPASAEETPQ